MNVKNLLKCAGFSDNACYLAQQIPVDGNNENTFAVILDDANLLRYVLEDFTEHTSDLQSLSYTHLNAEMLDDEEDMKNNRDFKTETVGPGFHKHNLHNNLYLCYETTNKQVIMHQNVHRYINRAALVSGESLQVLRDYVNTIRKKSSNENKLSLFVACEMGGWQQEKISRRKPNTLFLPTVWPKVWQDAKDFMSTETKQWYTSHNIPYVRTYVFHGEPGLGKSACIRTLASALNCDLYSLNLSMAKLDDMSLISLVRDVDKGSIIAIEDIDRIFDNFSVNQTSSHISFSTLLNVLDGSLAKEGVIFVLTCNNYQHMDDALKRCGRVDRVFEFPTASKKVMKQMFANFYPSSSDNDQKTFAKKVSQVSSVPIATLQEFFIRNRKRSATEALLHVDGDDIFRKRRKREPVNAIM